MLVATRVAFSKSWRALALASLLASTLLVRLWLIRHFSEPDTDAPGHLGIARALLSDPTNISLHWVWLPAYHYVLAGMLWLGLNADGIRIVNCGLAVLVPVLVLHYAESTTEGDGSSRAAPWMAAGLCAISPVVNLLGTSAQQETLFTLLVVGAAWAIDRRRYVVAGGVLALASLIRYETWGAAVLILGLRALVALPAVAKRLPERALATCRLPVVVAWPSLFAVGGWLLAHKLREGEWLGVLRELYRYSHVQRESLHRPAIWFPLEQPLFVFGSVVLLLFVFGLPRAWRPSFVLPAGIYLFLVGAYLGKGALGSARYYESLTPFVALGAAHGVCAITRWRWIGRGVFAAAALQLSALSVELCLWTWPPAQAEARTTPAAEPPRAAAPSEPLLSSRKPSTVSQRRFEAPLHR